MSASEKNKSVSESVVPVNATHASDVIGDWGPIQWRILIFLTIVYMMAPFSNNSMPYYAPVTDFYCHHYNETSGTMVASKNKCTYELSNTTRKCSNFTYEMGFHKRTLTSEFDLICDQSWYVSFTGSAHQIGYAVSAILIGVLSDVYGRTFAAKMSLALEIIAGFGQAFAPTIYWFFFARFFVGIAASGRFNTSLVLITEWFGPKCRAQGMGIFEYGSRPMGMSFPWIFYAIADYKITQASASSVEIVLFVLYFFVILESPHWLMTKGKFEQVEKHLTTAAKAKGNLDDEEIKRRIQSMKENTIKEFEEEKKKKEDSQSIWAVWRDPALRQVSLIIFYTHFSQSLIIYASGFNAQNLGGDMYINGLVTNIISIGPLILFVVIIEKFQRRSFLLGTMAIQVFGLTGVLIATSFNFHYSVIVAFSFISGTVCGMMKNTFNLYTSETFPTSMRQSAMGICSLFGRCGSIIAPFSRELNARTSLTTVTGIYLVFATFNFSLLWLLPETRDYQLPDTVAQKKKQIERQTSEREKQVTDTLQRPSV